MDTDLYLSFHLAEIGRTLVIDGDGFSVYAFLLKEDDESIDFDGFLCSTGTLVENEAEVARFIQEGNQPPLMKQYANEHSVVKDLKADEVGVEVLDDETLAVSIRGKQYLLLDIAEKQSYTIAVTEDGPYGYVLMSGEGEEEEE
ncbi:hypothetical protein [Cesiribacter sp. SM1]|uniref:hypothetical protein n=1 Tax=Cesiribacter sp. SM1 TaxID=2861196 RepID=UPI001CD4B867|nr:hypothetical protein [Cesiribacter sp. SM1]